MKLNDEGLRLILILEEQKQSWEREIHSLNAQKKAAEKKGKSAIYGTLAYTLILVVVLLACAVGIQALESGSFFTMGAVTELRIARFLLVLWLGIKIIDETYVVKHTLFPAQEDVFTKRKLHGIYEEKLACTMRIGKYNHYLLMVNNMLQSMNETGRPGEMFEDDMENKQELNIVYGRALDYINNMELQEDILVSHAGLKKQYTLFKIIIIVFIWFLDFWIRELYP